MWHLKRICPLPPGCSGVFHQRSVNEHDTHVNVSPATLRKGFEEVLVPLVRRDVQHFPRPDQVHRGRVYCFRRRFHLR